MTCAEKLPDRGSAALLLIDVINDMDFPKNEQLVRKSGASCQAYRCSETTLQKGGIPTIYVNDNNERFPAYEPPLVITAQARSSEQRKLAKNG
jgi:hypothetical protein